MASRSTWNVEEADMPAISPALFSLAMSCKVVQSTRLLNSKAWKVVFSQMLWKRTFANWRFSAVLLYVALSCRFFRPWVMSSLNSLHWVMPSRRFRPGNFKFCKTSRLIWCVHHFDAISFNWCVVNCLSCLLRASPWLWEPASTSRSPPQSSYQDIFFLRKSSFEQISSYQNIRIPTKMITWIFFKQQTSTLPSIPPFAFPAPPHSTPRNRVQS